VSIVVCVSYDCPRYVDCARTEGYGQVEAFATHGYGYISAEGIVEHNDCGPLGGYAMFKPKPKNMPDLREAEWIDDPHGSTYRDGRRIFVKVCSKCGGANPFNIVGEPYYPQYCSDCGRAMRNSPELTMKEIFAGGGCDRQAYNS